ncbi:TPA: hypothetical protein N0F65_001806 [Lagenidium giganteum]|uniref:Uncharacterized protein n=1 Tax=Lagenidium giganteum TaxID=4803 RepID=A0AAV2Z1T8_9STRA|nr:TPA: hypothetical protein N0F65_001806 [Lagenidium giganteum]
MLSCQPADGFERPLAFLLAQRQAYTYSPYTAASKERLRLHRQSNEEPIKVVCKSVVPCWVIRER